jgi:hypothetical protein
MVQYSEQTNYYLESPMNGWEFFGTIINTPPSNWIVTDDFKYIKTDDIYPLNGNTYSYFIVS